MGKIELSVTFMMVKTVLIQANSYGKYNVDDRPVIFDDTLLFNYVYLYLNVQSYDNFICCIVKTT